MAKDTVKHNNITYYGIATYGDLSNIIGETESYDEDRCLSKEAADKISTIMYEDDGDPNKKKLLRYVSISKSFDSINIYFENINNDDTIYISQSAITFLFYDTEQGTTKDYVINPLNAYKVIFPGEEVYFTIPNYRKLISTNINTQLQLGKVTISFQITKQVASVVTCRLTNPINTNTKLVYSTSSPTMFHDMVCELENTSKISGATPGGDTIVVYDKTELADYWPSEATYITFTLR